MIEISPSIFLDESEIQIDFIRASGPGGQNVNKVASAVQLRFNLSASDALPDEVKLRLRQIAGKRITEEGLLIIDARRFRTQEQNREDALNRLVHLIQQSVKKPKPRKKTKPSAAAQAERIDEKKHRGRVKKTRSITSQDLE